MFKKLYDFLNKLETRGLNKEEVLINEKIGDKVLYVSYKASKKREEEYFTLGYGDPKDTEKVFILEKNEFRLLINVITSLETLEVGQELLFQESEDYPTYIRLGTDKSIILFDKENNDGVLTEGEDFIIIEHDNIYKVATKLRTLLVSNRK